MNDITELFGHYLSQYGSIDIAESEFKKTSMKTKISMMLTANGATW